MKARIWSRKPEEKGGYAMMSMRKNIPVGRDDWELTTCPECGCECWKSPVLNNLKNKRVIALCTECALRKAK